MPYVAHVGVILADEYSAYEKNKWCLLSQHEGLRFHRRIGENNSYEIACELFEDRSQALLAAKYMYTMMLYNLLYNGIGIAIGGCSHYEKRLYVPQIDGDDTDFAENSFFWTPKLIGGGIGVDVYEVPESFQEFDEIYKVIYKMCGGERSFYSSDDARKLEFNNYSSSPFLYDKESQKLLDTMIQADSVFDIGLQMTLYCGVLEHLAPECNKEDTVTSLIDQLVEHVNCSQLPDDQKTSLRNYLKFGKKESSRKRCLMLCRKYAKEQYGSYKTEDIFEDAYSIRSAYSHGADCSNRYSGPAPYIKLVVLDVIIGHMRAKQASV